MAYTRYVHKKGKRHGPYYYKNVRDESGKVRSIYLGKASARGKRPLEAAIVFLIVLLITISALFFVQNRNLVLSRIAAEESQVPFEVDQILIKVLVKADEYVEKELRVMNVGDEERSILVDVSGVSDIVNAVDKGFIIKPGQTKIVRLNFSSFNSVEGIEQAPGVHIGKILVRTDSYEKDVPVVVEIESKNVLFDMNLNPVARDRSVLQGASTTFEIRVFNLQSIESSNVDMEFFVKDTNGNTIISEKESVVVKTQASFFKTLKIPENLKTGNYVFAAKASFGNSVGIASYLFEVEEAAKEKKAANFIGFCRNDPLCWSLSIIVLLLIFTVGAYAYFFIGAFIYRKMFGIRAPKPKKAEEAEAKALIAEGKKENHIAKFFRGWKIRSDRARELRLKKKLEFETQKLKLQEREEKLKEQRLREKEKEFEIKNRLEEKKEKEESRGLTGKCRRLIDKGYNALDKNNLRKADNAYAKLMDVYINLPSERKIEVFKEINSFYKSLLLKTSQLKQKEEEEERMGLKRKEHDELDAKRKEEEKIRKAKLREELRKEGKKKAFEFFHGLGLVKTEKEKRELGMQKQKEKEVKELEEKKEAEERRKADEEAEKRKLEEERQRQIEIERKEEERRRIKLEKKKQKEIDERRKEEGRIGRAKSREKLRKERKKEREKKAFEFFHGLGLVKTEKEKRELGMQKQKEKELKEIEKKNREEERRKAGEEAEKRKLEEERQREIGRKRIELEKKKQKELEEKRRVEEERQRQLEIERKEEERRKKQEEKNKKLSEIKDLESSAGEKDNKIKKLREKIRKTASEKDAMANEISGIEKDIEDLNNEKKTLFKLHNESAESRKEITGDYESKLAEWKNRHDAKLKEKNQLRAEVKTEYESKIKELESELEGLSRKDRPEQEKWKRLELKAKYKLGERERENAITEELKILQMEKKEIEDEFSRKKESLGKDAAGKDVIQKQKEINDHIMEHERDVERLKKEIEDNEKALERFSNSIGQLSEEKERIKEKLRQKRKESGLGYVTSFFRFEKKKKEPENEGIRKEKPKAIKEKEVPEKKKALPEKKEAIKEKPKIGLFSRLFEKKEKAKKPEAEAKAEEEKEERKEAEEELEESLKDLGKAFEQKKEKEALKEEIKVKKEIERKREGKSRLFVKCHKLLLKADEALQNNDVSRAKRLYLKTRNLYIKLEYMEKKEVYGELTTLYNKLSK